MHNNKNKILIALTFSVACILLAFGFDFSRAQVAPQINVSAFISNEKNESLQNGEYDVRFVLYRNDRTNIDPYPSDSDASQRVWQETQKIYIRDGVLGAYLGANVALPEGLNFSSSEYYVGIRINTDSEFVPRKKMGSAVLAMDSMALGGATLGNGAGNIVQLDADGKIDTGLLLTGSGSKSVVLGNDSRFDDVHLQNADTGSTKLVFNVGSGNGLVGNNFDLAVGNGAEKPALRFNGALNAWQFSNDGNIFTNLGAGNIDASQISSGILDVQYGGTGQNSLIDLIALGSNTTGNYVASVSGGNGILGGAPGSEGAALTLGINLLDAADGVGLMASNSGLQFAGVSGDQLSLLQGCTDGQTLKWDIGSTSWVCANDLGVSSAVIMVSEGVTPYAGIDTLDFNNNDFSINKVGTVANIAVDYLNSGITRKTQNETVSGAWTFSNAASIWNGSAIGGGYGGTGINNYTVGDMLYATGATTLSKLAIGTPGQVLISVGGVPTWASSAPGAAHNFLSTAHSDTTAASVSRGAIITGQGVAPTWSLLGPGTSGQLLKSNGVGADLSWITLTKNDIGLGSVENTALSTWTGSGNISNVGTIAGGTWHGSAIAPAYLGTTVMVEGENISLLSNNAGYITSSSVDTLTNKSGNISQWTNNSGYITDGNTNWDNSYGFITASSTDTLTNKTWNGNAIGLGYGGLNANVSAFNGILKISGGVASAITDNSANWNTAFGWGNHSSMGYLTASSTNTLTNKSGNISQWTNNAGYLTSFTETDPIFSASVSAAITNANVTNWNTAFGWGNHNSAGYITASSTNTLTNKSGNISQWTNNAGYITASSIDTLTNKTWNGNTLAANYGGTGIASYSAGDLLYATNATTLSKLTIGTNGQALTIVGGVPTWGVVSGSAQSLLSASHSDTTAASVSRGAIITGQGVAPTWSLLGPGTSGQLLKSNGVGSDLAWVTLTKNDIGLGNVENTALSTWTGSGNISNVGTITSGIWSGTNIAMNKGGLNADVSAFNGILKISGGVASIVTDNSANWNTAYGWGNHASAGYVTASSTNTLTNKSGNISQWTNDAGYLAAFSETDPVYIASSAASITATNIANWSTAFGWGNHASAGYLTGTKVDSFNSRTGAVTLTSADVTGALTFTPYNATNPAGYITDGNTNWDNSYGFITASSTDILTNKTWNGDIIGAQYGGTGINTSASTGVAIVNAGTWSIAASLGLAYGGTGATDAAGARTNLGLGSLATLSSVDLATNVTGILPVANGGTGTTTAFTQGSMVFAGASGVYAQDNTNIFWDNTNKRLGIGTATPLAKLDIVNNTLTTIGSELVSNGTFTGNANDWTLTDCSSYLNNEVTENYLDACGYANVSTQINTEAGKTYLLTFTLSDVSGDRVFYYFDNNMDQSSGRSFDAGTHTVAFKSNFTGADTITFENWNWINGSSWTIDNVSIKEAAPIAPVLRVLGYDGNVELSMGGDVLGNTSMGLSAFSSNEYGIENSAFGSRALYSNTAGKYNTAIGFRSLTTNTTGNGNTANGSYSLLFNTTGFNNTANGFSALAANVTGANNTASGIYSLASNIDGLNNSAVGAYSLFNNSNGSGNTAVGDHAGEIGNGNNSTFIGSYADAIGSLSNATAIGSNAIVGASNSLILGGTGTYAVNVGIGDTTPAALFTVGNGDLFQINTLGHIIAGSWRGATISAQYGGTGINTSASTGVATVNAGTWSIASSLGVTKGGTGTATTFTQGSMVFAGASGVYSQNNANLFWDNTNKRLGIGIAAPGYNLHVFAPGQASSNVPVDVMAVEIGAPTSGTNVGYGPSIIFKDLAVGVNNMARIAAVYENSGLNKAGALSFYTNPASPNALVERMRISNDGNVGIGDTTPASLFTVGNGDLFQINASGQIVAGVWNGSAIGLAYGGTGATDAAGARTNLGLGSLATLSSVDLTTNVSGILPVANGGTGTTTQFTQGSMVFAGASGVYSQNNANLYWDNTNNYFRLGAGATQFSMGVDETDSNKFKIFAGNGIAGTSVFSIGTDGVTNIASLSMGTQEFAADSGILSWIDMPVTGASANGVVNSYTAQLDGNPMLTVYGTSDGAGGVANLGVGIGTTTPGYILDVQHITSKINSKNGYLTNGADYAEYFYTKDTDLKPGEVVCVDVTNANSVQRCTRSGDNNVMGVVSTNPSIVGNGNGTERDNDPHYKVIGMIGQVPGNVSTENGAIQIGDNLTAAGAQGYLRKANAGESTVGVAIQSFSGDKGTVQVLISRRNQSLTVEKVEQAVTDNIASMNIQDQVNKLVAQAQTNFNQIIASQTTLVTDLGSQLASQSNLIKTLQDQMAELQIKTNSELSIAQIDLNIQDITLIKMMLGIGNGENVGDIAIAGKLTARAVEAGKLVVSVLDPNARTIGEAVITSVKNDADGDGKDDDTKSDGKTFFVKTKAVSVSSKVFITPKVALEQGMAVTEIKSGEGFIVTVKNSVTEDVPFDWVIVEEKL